MRELQGKYEDVELTDNLKSNIDKRLRYIYNVLKLEDMKRESHISMGKELSHHQKKCLQQFVLNDNYPNKFYQLTQFICNRSEDTEKFNEAELCYIKKMVVTLNRESKLI